MKLRWAIVGYIEHKRSNGVQYKNRGKWLSSFSRYVGDIELGEIKPDHLLAFLNRSEVSTHTWRKNYAQLADLFRHWHVLGATSAIQMPPPRGMVRPTFTPYIYSRSEVKALLEATSMVQQNANSTIHNETLRTLLLFVYGTGARASEVMALRTEDVDIESRMMRIRLNGSGTIRTLPIGQDLWRILSRYSKWKMSMDLQGEFLLMRRDGSRLLKDGVYNLFRKLLLHTGITRRDRMNHRPRIHDFRATFAVHQISSWIRKGRDINRLLPALSGYLGQTDLTSAERYLSLTPERFKRELDKLSPQNGERWAANHETMTFLSTLVTEWRILTRAWEPEKQ